MNPLGDLTLSFRGWAEIFAGKPSAGANFRTDVAGLAAAAAALLVAVLLSLAAQSVVIGMPGWPQIAFGLLGQAITVALLGVVVAQTLKFLQVRVVPNALLVPVLYALAYVFVLSIPLTLIGPNAALIAIFGLALMIWRAGTVLAGMRNGVSIAFAMLCVIVLVVVPNALYMLSALVPTPS